MSNHGARKNRRGNILVLSAFLMIAMMGFLALAVDIGYVAVAGSELQRSADSAAIAATWELIDEDALSGPSNSEVLAANARQLAAQYAGFNEVLNDGPALAAEDVTVGYIADPTDRNSPLVVGSADEPNAVRVRIRRAEQVNGLVPLFFARAMGFDGATTQAEATAAVLTNFRGFRAPGGTENLMMLPFALDQQTWEDLQAGVGSDTWSCDLETRQVSSGGDGVLEVNLFPQGTGSPGNRGTVDIGAPNNSTADLARQILYGITPQDLSYVGGSLELDENGEMELNGDTGISAGMKDELEAIKGQPRIIPIFSQVVGNGNNAQYTIVDFVGVCVLEVKLTGKMSSKRVIVQPTNVKTRGGIPSTGPKTSSFVYSPVWLVR
jgi:Flp pilus assembly protein TadG